MSFQGWLCIFGLGVVDIEQELDCGVGEDEYVEVAAEHAAGEQVEVAVVVGVEPEPSELFDGDVMEDALEETFDDKDVLDVKVVGKVLEAKRGVAGEKCVALVEEMVGKSWVVLVDTSE